MLSHAPTSRKRPREAEDTSFFDDGQTEKKARPTIEASGDGDSWARDSVISTPTAAFHARQQPQDDSDNDLSSVVSERGSPQDMDMTFDDDPDGEDLTATISRSTDESAAFITPQSNGSRFGQGYHATRIPTPTISPGLGLRLNYKDAVKQHVRQRHPQENLSSDHLGPPSPIDEDEVPTPPSAAKAPESQLSLLTVNDVDMDGADQLPTISVDPTQPLRTTSPAIGGVNDDHDNDLNSAAVDLDPMDSTSDVLLVRKQRQRSGALSSGHSPVRSGPSNVGGKRGFSIGFRADCQKCQMRVPGHMNHFIS